MRISLAGRRDPGVMWCVCDVTPNAWGSSWFSRSCLTKSEDKLPKVPLLKYYTYNLGATAQVLSAGGPGLIAPGGTPGKIKLACTRRYGVTFWRQIRSI